VTTEADTPLGVLRPDGETFAVRFERDYPTTPQDLWDAVTAPDRLERWLAPVTGDPRPGGEVVLRFPDGDVSLRVTRCEPPHALAVEWVHPQPGVAPSVVTADLRAIGGDGCRLVLEHSRLTRTGAPGYSAGWHWYLAGLAATYGAAVPPAWDDTFDTLMSRYAAELPTTKPR
jgi:uncharacterized protein YndB with AHSA1/START domain